MTTPAVADSPQAATGMHAGPLPLADNAGISGEAGMGLGTAV